MTDGGWIAPGSGPPDESSRPTDHSSGGTDPQSGPPHSGQTGRVPPQTQPIQGVGASPGGLGPPGSGSPGSPSSPGSPGPPGWIPTSPGIRATAFQPGIIPLRPLDLNTIYSGVLRTIRGNVAATIGLATMTSVIFLVPFTVLGAWVNTRSLEYVDFTELSEDEFATDPTSISGVAGQGLTQVGAWLATVILVGFMAYVIGQAVQGRKVGIGETWRGTRGRIPALVGATLLVGLGYVAAALLVVAPAVVIGTVTNGFDGAGGGAAMLIVMYIFGGTALLVVLMFFLWTRLALINASVVLDHAGPVQAIRRSWMLTKGSFWRIAGIRLLTTIGVFVVGIGVSMPFGVLGELFIGSAPPEQAVVGLAINAGITALLVSALTSPMSAGVDALLFVDQRIRHEGLDLELLAAAQGSSPPVWPTAS